MSRAIVLFALVAACVPSASHDSAALSLTEATSTEPTSTTEPTTVASDDTTAATTGGACPAPAPCGACTCEAGAWDCACPAAAPEAGFFDIEPVTYWLGPGEGSVQLTASPARLFYSFQPSTADAGDAPLLLLFNGGPGATTGLLLAGNTAPMTLGADGEPAVNPHPWTAIGHLLYVDARNAGYSYARIDDPDDPAARADEFTTRNYNSYLDAADFARVLLRFWEAHPELATRPLVLVGESYGGIRASLLLHMLLYPQDYAHDGPGRYRDPALAAAIADHLAARFPGVDPVTPAIAGAALGHLVLIQPGLAGVAQDEIAGAMMEAPGSPVYALAEELGLVYTTCVDKPQPCDPLGNALSFVEYSALRSPYDIAAPQSWFSDLLERTRAGLLHRDVAAALLQVDPADIVGLPSDQRQGAFRMPLATDHPFDDVGDLLPLLGALADHDRYYLPFSHEAASAFVGPLAQAQGVHPRDPHYGELFLRDLAHADVFITSATRDLAIWSPAIGPTLAGFSELVAAVELDLAAPAEAARAGVLRVQYAPDALPGGPDPGVREIRMPTYDASHAVTYDQPEELRADVAEWLLAHL